MTSIDNYNNKVEYLENESGNRNCGEEVTWSKVTKKEKKKKKKEAAWNENEKQKETEKRERENRGTEWILRWKFIMLE